MAFIQRLSSRYDRRLHHKLKMVKIALVEEPLEASVDTLHLLYDQLESVFKSCKCRSSGLSVGKIITFEWKVRRMFFFPPSLFSSFSRPVLKVHPEASASRSSYLINFDIAAFPPIIIIIMVCYDDRTGQYWDISKAEIGDSIF